MRLASLVALSMMAGLAASTTLSLPAQASSRGRVVTFAEQPGQPPTYILPLESSAEESNANFAQFSNILYPPVYVFDANGKPVLDQSLSIGKLPAFSDNNTVVKITLKHWLWSNGQPVTARDLVFWMNLLSAVTDPNAPAIGSSTAPGPGYGFFVPGGFPENVVSYRQTGKYTMVLHLNGSYNPTWFLYNELSQITPIPQQRWDRLSQSAAPGDADASAAPREALPNTSPGLYVPADAGTATSGALGVAQFLNAQAQRLSTYSSNPLWKVVDGAFKMARYTTSGFLKLVPNRRYTGSPKPTISAFEELPYTTDQAEVVALRSGNLTVGYLTPQELAAKAQFEKGGGYKFSPWSVYGIGYASYNFTNPTTGPMFKQLYFRQALQSLVNQPQYISKFLGGYGSDTEGPVPNRPATRYTSPLESGRGPYPYDPAKARHLLSAHGWKVVPGGQSYCAKPGVGPGECGQGVKAHQAAAFTLLYAAGSTPGTNMVEALQSIARQRAGMVITPRSEPFDDVIGTEFGGCTTSNPCPGWDVADLFVGWTFGPDYLPSGGEIFGTGAGSNSGYYSNATNDANISRTHTALTGHAETRAMYQYENFLARQLPAVWMPLPPLQLTLYKHGLRGLTPQGIIDQVFPQFYRWSTS
ncbi:MAG: ABC transporter substrate-binding protein [Candidatus Dormibacteria bacterium]